MPRGRENRRSYAGLSHPYSVNLTKLLLTSWPHLEILIVHCGDFNKDLRNKSEIVDIMKNEFGLNNVTIEPTTLGNITIDCTFTRHIDVDITSYVSYYQYHQPMVREIVIEYQLNKILYACNIQCFKLKLICVPGQCLVVISIQYAQSDSLTDQQLCAPKQPTRFFSIA